MNVGVMRMYRLVNNVPVVYDYDRGYCDLVDCRPLIDILPVEVYVRFMHYPYVSYDTWRVAYKEACKYDKSLLLDLLLHA